MGAERRGASLEELEAVYRSSFREFVRVAWLIVGEREEAWDAVQDAFASAVRARSSFDRRGPLEAWLWRIVVNAARQRRRRKAPPVVAETALVSVPSSNGLVERDARLRGFIASLPERQRLVVFLRYFADLDYRTIARVLDVREGTVAAALNAAHRSLRTALAANEVSE